MVKKCQISPFRSSSRLGGINPGAVFPDTFVTPEDGIERGGLGGGQTCKKFIKLTQAQLLDPKVAKQATSIQICDKTAEFPIFYLTDWLTN